MAVGFKTLLEREFVAESFWALGNGLLVPGSGEW